MKAILLVGGETGLYTTTECAYPMPTIEVPVLPRDWRRAFLEPEPPHFGSIPSHTITFCLVGVDIKSNIAVYMKLSEKTQQRPETKKED